ncbi:3-oxoacyl-ACP synthase [Pedobacter nutrimenti]|uniref:3-oxoacyl-ACP synthase n=1 Tax=Pedobacter nutrimenti TaxID=1241337 RepID=UPI0029311140|nr:3-oxoacyl-ACP synthase [Pedobacter nutrimenti]
MDQIKDKLYQLCADFIEQRIHTAETALLQAQEASNDDTKSSAGDKFETTREMMQQDITRNKSLLMDAKQNLQLLHSIKDVPVSETIRNGSLVYTSNGVFYISISAGQLNLEGETYFAISAASPVGKLMTGKKVNELFSFNQKEYQIEAIL